LLTGGHTVRDWGDVLGVRAEDGCVIVRGEWQHVKTA
jgi:hypothetical protein